MGRVMHAISEGLRLAGDAPMDRAAVAAHFIRDIARRERLDTRDIGAALEQLLRSSLSDEIKRVVYDVLHALRSDEDLLCSIQHGSPAS
jgi:hypothetical protein